MFGFNLGPTAVQQTAESAVRNHWPKGLFETAPGQTHQRTCPTNSSSRAATVERLIIVIEVVIIIMTMIIKLIRIIIIIS